MRLSTMTNLIYRPALNAGAVIIQIVELNLHHLDLRVLGENLFQHLGLVVEGNADVPDLSRRLQLLHHLIGVAACKFLVYLRRLRVHQVIVEVVHPRSLFIYFYFEIFSRFEILFK